MHSQLLINVPLHWPNARYWMWNYCIYLGPYEHEGDKYDLGVFVSPEQEISAAIVYGNTPGDYMSGDLRMHMPYSLIYMETYNRAKAIGLVKE